MKTVMVTPCGGVSKIELRVYYNLAIYGTVDLRGNRLHHSSSTSCQLLDIEMCLQSCKVPSPVYSAHVKPVYLTVHESIVEPYQSTCTGGFPMVAYMRSYLLVMACDSTSSNLSDILELVIIYYIRPIHIV